MRMLFSLCAVLLATFSVGTSTVRASLLAEWNVPSSPAQFTASLNSTSHDPGIQGPVAITPGNGLTAPTTAHTGFNVSSLSENIDDALANGDYLEFIVNPAANVAVTYTEFSTTFDSRERQDWEFRLYAKTASQANFTELDTVGGGVVSEGPQTFTFDISGFNNIGEEVTFRLALADNSSSDDNTVGFEDINQEVAFQLQGTVVPEPGSMIAWTIALLALGALGYASRQPQALVA